MATDHTPGALSTAPAEQRTPFERWLPALPPATNGTGLDSSVPHPARVYAYWLGGKDNFAADRDAAEEVIRLRPQVVAGARANRAFLARVVRYLAADCGVRQFLDLGTGLPCPDNTHEIAQQVAAGCRVVYVDNDRNLPGSMHVVEPATRKDRPGEPSSGVREGQHGKPG